MWHLKHHTNEPIYARESDSQTQRIDLCLLVGGGGGKPGVGVVGMGEERDRRREREGNTPIYSSPWTEVACRNSFFYKKGILWG